MQFYTTGETNKIMEFTKEQLENRQFAIELLDEAIQKVYDGKLLEAEEIATRSRDTFEAIGDRRNVAGALNILSIIYDELGNDTIDIEYMLEALDISLEEKAYEIVAKIYNNLGSEFMLVKDYSRALNYFMKSVEAFENACKDNLVEEKESAPFLIILDSNLAYNYCAIGELDKAEFYYQKAKELSTYPENDDLRLTFMAFEGVILWKLGKKEQAAELSLEILNTASSIEYTTDYMEVMSYLIELLKDLQDYPNWEKALRILDEHHNETLGLSDRVEIMHYWIEYYKTIGDAAGYQEACIKYYELSQQKYTQDNEHKADEIDLKFKIRRAAREKQKTDSIVYLDTLTQIGNRNKMLEDSTSYIESSIKNKTPITIGLIDIDFFKECNDTYGHIEGDACLVTVANIIKNAVGTLGNVYRYGGDEFLLLLPDTTINNIRDIGENIKLSLDAAKVRNVKSPIKPYVTVSQGYTLAYAEDGDTIEQLVNLADRVLYSVKRCGRNNFRFMPIDEIIADIK